MGYTPVNESKPHSKHPGRIEPLLIQLPSPQGPGIGERPLSQLSPSLMKAE